MSKLQPVSTPISTPKPVETEVTTTVTTPTVESTVSNKSASQHLALAVPQDSQERTALETQTLDWSTLPRVVLVVQQPGITTASNSTTLPDADTMQNPQDVHETAAPKSRHVTLLVPQELEATPDFDIKTQGIKVPESKDPSTRSRTGGTPVPQTQRWHYLALSGLFSVMFIVYVAFFYFFFKGIIQAWVDAAPNFDL